MELTIDDTALLRDADELVQNDKWEEAVDMLTCANRQVENAQIEARLAWLRHRAYVALMQPAEPAPWPTPVPNRFSDVQGLPEIEASELSAELLHSAIQHYGALLVRGMIPPDKAESIREAIDMAFQDAADAADNPSFEPSAWYTHFKSFRKKGYKFAGAERSYAQKNGGVHAVDSPRTLFRYLDALESIGFPELLRDYFGERAALSAKKSTLRRTQSTALAGWHQDGAFLGADTRSLNIWMAFSPCGIDAPSLDVFTKRFDHLVEMGGEDIFSWAVSEDTAESFGIDSVVRPVFAPGDALLFDQLTLHRTGVDPSMTKTRYAIEMWFFAASTYPHDQVPLLF